MRTALYRVGKVLTAIGSPVARIEAVDADGHEVRLEVPVVELGSAAPGRVLVLQWSMHGVPDDRASSQRTDATSPAAATNTTASTTSVVSVTPADVDQEFMDLMARSKRTDTGAREAGAGPTTHNEFDVLLGSAQRKG